MSEGASAAMPAYRSHKIVHALKMKTIDFHADGGATFVPEESSFAPIVLSVEYCTKHEPKAGGYYVVYQGGYMSWSPADAFEDGYTRATT